MPDPQRLSILTDLRHAAGLSLTDMARRCGLTGKQSHQTAGAWERGVYTPTASRRARMIGYLWDDLGLRREASRFEEVWTILVEEWAWAAIEDEEWQAFTAVPRPSRQVEADATLAPAAQSSAPPFQAPAVTPHFVGRQAVQAEIAQLLLNGGRPVALVGMGGVGKTTLATESARRLRPHFPDGVLWASVAVSDPLDILNSWARAYGHDYGALVDVESRAAAVRSLLAPKRVLMVLDDVGPPGLVKALLPGSANAAVLITTRSEDAAVSLQSHVLHPAELATAESLDLLSSMVGAARVDAQREDGTELCTLLHNLPLAVEIAGQLLAARGHRSLGQLAARLRDAQSRLDLGIADRDVRASFLVSWETLDDAHRALFSHMGLFAGRAFTAPALAAVMEIAERDAVERLDDLAALSLVTPVADERFRQHPLLADFALEMLAEPAQAWQRFAQSQLAFAQAHQHDYAALSPEWDNLMAGMEQAYSLELWQTVLDFADALAEGWHSGAHYQRARRGFGWAAEAAAQIQDVPKRAAHRCHEGRICIELDEFDAAVTLLEEARGLAQSDSRPAGQSRYLLGRIAFERGEYERAEALLRQSEEILRQTEEGEDLALIYFHQAHVQYEQGLFEQAEALARFALSIQEEEKLSVDAMGTLRLLADIMIEREELTEAERCCQQALTLGAVTNNRVENAAVRYTLAVIRRKEDALEEAAEQLRQAAELVEPAGLLFMQAVILMEESRINYLAGELPVAKETIIRAIDRLRTLGRPFNLVYALDLAGLMHRELDDAATARRCFEEALALCNGSGHPHVAEVLAHMGG